MSAERLQKLLARAGVASRRHAEELIAEGRVTVNGRMAGVGDKADPARDAVKVDGKRLEARRPGVYLLLNKPRAVMSTASDPEGRPTVLDLVPPALRKALVPVGRLDFLTEGLIVLTDDGELAQRIAHPRYGCGKTYEAKVRGEPAEAALERLRGGIMLEGRRTAPARIVRRRIVGPAARRGGEEEGGNSWWTVELSEGRTRQIREMFTRIGHPVMKLRRVAVGPVVDRRLPVGAVRELSEREVEALRRATEPDGGRAAKAKGRAGWAKAKPKSGSKAGAKPGVRPGAKPPAKAAPKHAAKTSGRPRAAGRAGAAKPAGGRSTATGPRRRGAGEARRRDGGAPAPRTPGRRRPRGDS
jgi:23S rRNA pseudouridine2605 synthase